MAKIYYEQDADLNVLKGKTLAVIGYGNQGRNQALNLKDSGIKVVIGAHSEKTMAQAKADGFEAYTAKEAAAKADIIQILIQDDLQGALYKNDVLPSLKAGKALMFSHGFNIHFGQIVPPADVDVFMIAPKGPGHLVRPDWWRRRELTECHEPGVVLGKVESLRREVIEMSVQKIHYRPSSLKAFTACGLNVSDLLCRGGTTFAQVTCGNCLRVIESAALPAAGRLRRPPKAS